MAQNVTTQQQPPPPPQTVSPNLAATKFIAGLFWSTTSGLHRRCAATIVANNVLLTSASCALDKYPNVAHGPGQWVVVTAGDSRFTQKLAAGTQSMAVKSVDIDQCANLATITLTTPLAPSEAIKPILMSNAQVPLTAMLNTYNTSNPFGSPFLALTQGNQQQCEAIKPQYSQDKLICTQPIQGQFITSDYLGGDPIIGFSVQGSTPVAVLVGITGQFYSNLVNAQTGGINDPAAYRFSGLVGSRIAQIASTAGVEPATLTSSNPLG
ncbi:hypothetical protein GGH91_004905 [Coemansia sp. RSA 2671]|nr:hypothetical protein LPJ60_004687 [Coemansia sp. RSA 2675]KAJ2031989.1 hypothetical protein IWW57_000445 [Coemansia sp. S610]KAJ2338143.1 hypothetical protein GGH91_004905 [Coemansia sp. RSA 2671]KAJ2385879.1 hypothetical protein H4S02_004118 [Coemansia sp. RSA 2611]